MKDKLGGKIVTTLVGLRPKTYYSNLIDDGCGEKKNKQDKEVYYKTKT